MKLSKRHIIKTISWRFIGTLDTLLLSWLITGNLFTGFKISAVEIITKMILYYFHEKFWYKSKVNESKKRHLYKTITWRVIGTIDTIAVGWLISGDPFIGLQIGFLEVITKMVLYFFHEKIWYRINYGLNLKNRRKNLKNI